MEEIRGWRYDRDRLDMGYGAMDEVREMIFLPTSRELMKFPPPVNVLGLPPSQKSRGFQP